MVAAPILWNLQPLSSADSGQSIHSWSARAEFSWSEVLQEAFLNSLVFLLVGSLVIGVLTGEHGWQVLEPLLRECSTVYWLSFCSTWDWLPPAELKNCKKRAFSWSVLWYDPNRQCRHWTLIANLSNAPEMHFVCRPVLVLPICCPAAMRITVPEANPSLYVSTALLLRSFILLWEFLYIYTELICLEITSCIQLNE